jgi:hypothetical protein
MSGFNMRVQHLSLYKQTIPQLLGNTSGLPGSIKLKSNLFPLSRRCTRTRLPSRYGRSMSAWDTRAPAQSSEFRGEVPNEKGTAAGCAAAAQAMPDCAGVSYATWQTSDPTVCYTCRIVPGNVPGSKLEEAATMTSLMGNNRKISPIHQTTCTPLHPEDGRFDPTSPTSIDSS